LGGPLSDNLILPIGHAPAGSGMIKNEVWVAHSLATKDLGPPGPGSFWTWPETSERWGLPLLFLVVVTAYGIGSKLALLLIEASDLQGVLFIPSGITVAFLIRLRHRLWWVVLLAAGLTEFTMDVTSGLTAMQSLGFAVANIAEPLVGAAIVISTCGLLDLGRRRHLLWFTLGAVLIGPAVGGALGAGSDRLFGGDDFLTTMAQWWLGDALGVVLVASAILAWGSSQDRRSLFSSWGAFLILGSVALTVVVITLTDLPLVFSVLVGVTLAGALFGVRTVAVTSLAVALTLAVTLTLDDGGLIVGLSQSAALVLVKLQVGTFALAGLMIAAESNEREIATREAARSAVEAEAAKGERQRQQDLAVHVQRGLLPDELVRKAGLEIAARYEAASDSLEVGGDWYDTIRLPDGRIGLVVGDIVGHGIDAMTSMGRLRSALAALAIHNDQPAALLTELDAFVGGPNGIGYATVFYAIVDSDQRLITYASAGHPPALLMAPNRDVSWLDLGQNEPLHGSGSERVQSTVPLEHGSILLLYSDGLIERRGESLGVGMRRLELALTELANREPDAICDGLIDRLEVLQGRRDDVVVMAMKADLELSNRFHRVFVAEPEELRHIRASIRSWATARHLPPDLQGDLLIVVGEATSNSVRHAFRNSPSGEIDIRLSLNDSELSVRVSDNGRWLPPSDKDDQLGAGTRIIRSVSGDFHRSHSSNGTVVTFTLPLTDRAKRS